MFPLIEFPNPRLCRNDDGVVCVSELDFLNPENLMNAYRRGIFPWMVEDYPYVPWFSPPQRAILEFDKLHIPKSLRKAREKSDVTFTIDEHFAEVVYQCSIKKRKGQSGTWITDEIFESYGELFQQGNAHSIEVWSAEKKLVGGLYGVDAGGVFCGESMFHHESNASKFALLFLVEHLQSKGATWIDIQVMTPHFELLGAKEIPRENFLDKLEQTLSKGLKLF